MSNRSGLPWASGVYLPSSTPAIADGFAAWRGHPVDVTTVWANRATWSDITNPAFMYQRWTGAPETVAFGVAMLPEGVPGVSLQAGANGDYNAYWQQFGANIAAYPSLARSVIRLGWEFNGNWYIWKATDPVAFAAYWQQVVTTVRASAPDLQWCWNVNRGISSGLADPTQAYPGDVYVDSVGVDSYDMWPPVTSPANWNSQLNATQALNYWLNFAKAHGKTLAVPEWGNITTQGVNSGGDNAVYVNDMLSFFKANAAYIAWESVFQGPSTGGNYGTNGVYGGASSPVPNAAAAYKAGWSSTVQATGLVTVGGVPYPASFGMTLPQ